ncbi:uncharacterized protein LOC124962748 isoform X2 [Sciurus carolinensis]|uniref:uncharacterized protein LOC124962748 isoform X2 n=1 Tax=Sciurus carolinensis TaxID=30640 RepID=UPI001FB26787|nr:uncharacterized protein LOC124962748 isoform X2 [Sciurus carolinensis]
MGWRVGGTWIYTATALCFPSFCPVETESPEEAGASQVGPVKGRVCLFSLHLPAVPDAACCRWRTRRDPPWERMFQTPWRADRAEKGTLPLLAISHPHQDPDPPLPLSFMALDWSLRFLARCRLCTATTPSATGRQTAIQARSSGEFPGKVLAEKESQKTCLVVSGVGDVRNSAHSNSTSILNGRGRGRPREGLTGFWIFLCI